MIHTISDSDSGESETARSCGTSVPSAVSSQSSSTSNKVRKRRTKEEIAADKKAKLAARAEREAEREKMRFMKPGECLKFVEAGVDVSLVENKTFGAALLSSLRSLPGLSVRIVPETQTSLPPDCGIVRWRRRETSQDENWSHEPDVFLILSSAAFLSLTTGNCEKLDAVVTELQTVWRGALVVAVYGKVNRKVGQGARASVLSLAHWHEVTVRFQLERRLSLHLMEDAEEMGRLLRCFTKSVAERRIKQASRSAEAIFGTSGANVASVRVVDDEASVARLWRQQLMQLRHVTGEVADAIVAVYRSPRALATAFRDCGSEQQARALLADVEVRRGAGLLQTKRRVGKELARRLYELLTATDPASVIR